ncbi:MAG: hypothetical protein JXR53_05680 [Bacteroidales bacterium]|nr:hypothetical protein [Bacteroidales bacterium]
MKRIMYLLPIIFTMSVSAQNSYRQLDADGIANMVFANDAIEKNMEANYNLKTDFDGDESVYARVYFPKAFGSYSIKSNEQFMVDVYVDGRFVQRKIWANPDSDWDQIQVYVLNTGDDDFSRLSSHVETLDIGDHSVLVSVGIERYQKTKDIIQEDGSIERKDVFLMETISKGTFTIHIK